MFSYPDEVAACMEKIWDPIKRLIEWFEVIKGASPVTLTRQGISAVYAEVLLAGIELGELRKLVEKLQPVPVPPISDGVLRLAEQIWEDLGEEKRKQFLDSLVDPIFAGQKVGEVSPIDELLRDSAELFFSTPCIGARGGENLLIGLRVRQDIKLPDSFEDFKAESIMRQIRDTKVRIGTIPTDQLEFGDYHGCTTAALKGENGSPTEVPSDIAVQEAQDEIAQRGG
ncbi:MAG: hypothetical protein NTZ65_04820 [Candidatus Berkelbacteria bacterium]|nr:hypothetical protein [Candidatus Berkelbacteria bacterium]